MHLHIEYKNNFEKQISKHKTCAKGINLPSSFEWQANLQGLLIDENKLRPIRSFNLTSDTGKTLASGVFTLLDALLIDSSVMTKGLKNAG